MAIPPDQLHEFLPLAQAAKLLPTRNGRPLHPSTLLRWIKKRALTAVRIGGVWHVHPDDLRAFIEQGTRAALPAPESPHPVKPIPVRQASDRVHDAEAVLRRHGL